MYDKRIASCRCSYVSRMLLLIVFTIDVPRYLWCAAIFNIITVVIITIHIVFYYPHDKKVGSDLLLTNRLMAYLFCVLIYMEPAGKWIILRCGWRQDVINKTVMFILFCPRVSIIIAICFYVLGPFRISCSWGRFKNTNELLNLRALKISALYKISIFQCMGKISWVEFQMNPLKFHTKYLTLTLKDTYFIHMWQFRSS